MGSRADRRGPRAGARAACAATSPGRTRSRPPSMPCTPTHAPRADTDWRQIVALYDQLLALRADARSWRSTARSPWPRWTGPRPAWTAIDGLDLDDVPPVPRHPRRPARPGSAAPDEAVAAYDAAIGLGDERGRARAPRANGAPRSARRPAPRSARSPRRAAASRPARRANGRPRRAARRSSSTSSSPRRIDAGETSAGSSVRAAPAAVEQLGVLELVGALRQHQLRQAVRDAAEHRAAAAVADDSGARRQDLRLPDEPVYLDVRRLGAECGRVAVGADGQHEVHRQVADGVDDGLEQVEPTVPDGAEADVDRRLVRHSGQPRRRAVAALDARRQARELPVDLHAAGALQRGRERIDVEVPEQARVRRRLEPASPASATRPSRRRTRAGGAAAARRTRP